MPARRTASSKTPDPPRAIVIGGGIAGVCSAYVLARVGGFAVTVLDAAPAAACESTAAAAGGMGRNNPSVSRADWLSTSRSMLSSMLTLRAPADDIDVRVGDDGDSSCTTSPPPRFDFFRLRPLATLSDPFFWRFFARFTRASFWPSSDAVDASREQLAFTSWAIDRTVDVARDERIDDFIGLVRTGTLSVNAALDASPPSPPSNSLERFELLGDGDAVRALEPWLHTTRFGVAATSGVVEPEYARGSSMRFTRALALVCQRRLGVEFRYNTRVLAFSTAQCPRASAPIDVNASTKQHADAALSHGRREVVTIHTTSGDVDVPLNAGDERAPVVVAAGAWTSKLLALLGHFAPVVPLKGYDLLVQWPNAVADDGNVSSSSSSSSSTPPPPPPPPPSRIVVHNQSHIFIAPFDYAGVELADALAAPAAKRTAAAAATAAETAGKRRSPSSSSSSITEVRIAAIGEFAGWDTSTSSPASSLASRTLGVVGTNAAERQPQQQQQQQQQQQEQQQANNDARVEHRVVRELRAYAADYLLPPSLRAAVRDAPVVAGLRPMTADGRLMIGRVDDAPHVVPHTPARESNELVARALPQLANVYVNTGPGFNGWKVGIGAAEVLTANVLARGRPDVVRRLLAERRRATHADAASFDPVVFRPDHSRAPYSPTFAALCRARWSLSGGV